MTDRLINEMRKKRLNLGLSTRGLSAIIGVSYSSIARMERGDGAPDAHSAERIIRWLENDEGSAPKVRSPAEENWLVKMDRRVTELEARVAQLEKP